MKLAAALLLTVPAAAAAQLAPFTEVQRAEGRREVERAGKLLADGLRDVSGARFRAVYLFKTVGRDGREHVSLCGEVNARNGYGGMTGFQPFTTVGDRLLTGSTGILNAAMVCDGGTPRLRDTQDDTADLRKAFDANAGQ